MISSVIFDLDGVLIDSEQLWDTARREVARRHGGEWTPEATLAMQGMSAPEWSRYMREVVGVRLGIDDVNRIVVDRLLALYRERLPLLPGAVEAVVRLSEHWPLGLASSSNREIIDEVLELAGLAERFAATVSSEEVARGKPWPDVYLEAARLLGFPPTACLAVEDSTNGIRSAMAARMTVIAVPNRAYPPRAEVLARSALVLESLAALRLEMIPAPH